MVPPLESDSVALFPHPERPAALHLALRCAAELARRGVGVVVSPGVATALVDLPAGVAVREAHELEHSCSLAVAVGGDGTLLRTFHEVPRLPLAGVNCGALGYLALVEPDDIAAFCDAVAAGSLAVDERLLLSAHRCAGTEPGELLSVALNDIVVGKTAEGRVPRVDVSVLLADAPAQSGPDVFATFLADAFVISTPTGSTAYNFSARGPVVSPDVEAFVFTPVAPHTLWDRPIVLSAGQRLVLHVSGDRPAQLSADGRVVHELPPGEGVCVGVAGRRAHLVRWGGETFAGRLRRAFGV